jgi:lysophospholipase L1-like esterase
MKCELRRVGGVLLIVAAAMGAMCGSAFAAAPDEPERRVQEYGWMSIAKWNEMHAKNLARAKEGGVDVLFLGDSITQGWGDNAAWKKYFAPRKAANFGIGGDTTRTVLWRITNGEVDGIKPKGIVLLIGTNNFGLHNDKPADTLRGVEKVVKTLREKLPESKILLMGLLPRDAKPDTDFRKRIKTLNEGLAKLAEAEKIQYLDIGDKYVEADGAISKELMPDALHLSDKGYAIWAEAIDPIVTEWLK